MSGESALHRRLVGHLANKMQSEFLDDPHAILLTDHEDFASDNPPMIFGFRPDVYLTNPILDAHAIGEAKTCGDLQSKRSHRQIKSFVEFAASQQGKFYLMVPFVCAAKGQWLVNAVCTELAAPADIAEVLLYDG